MLSPLNISLTLPLLNFSELSLERVLPLALSCSGPLRLKHLRLKFHSLRLVTFGLDPFHLHVEDTHLLEDGYIFLRLLCLLGSSADVGSIPR